LAAIQRRGGIANKEMTEAIATSANQARVEDLLTEQLAFSQMAPIPLLSAAKARQIRCLRIVN
jgi:hypothetical protein